MIKDITEGVVGSEREFDLGRFDESGGEVLLERGLQCLHKSIEDLQTSSKAIEWKVVLGCWIKSQCGVSNQWLADHLYMGSMYTVSRLVSQEQKRPQGRRKLWRLLKSAK